MILCDKLIKDKNGDYIYVPGASGKNSDKEISYFDTAKKYLLNDPRELLDYLLGLVKLKYIFFFSKK